MAGVMQKLHFFTGKTLKDVKTEIIIESTCRSAMRAMTLVLMLSVVGAVVACKYIFEDQLRNPEYTKRVTGYTACAAISTDRNPTCFCTNASTTYTTYASA